MLKNSLKIRALSIALSIALVMTLTPLGSPFATNEAKAQTTVYADGDWSYTLSQEAGGASLAAITKYSTGSAIASGTLTVPAIVSASAVGQAANTATVTSITLDGSQGGSSNTPTTVAFEAGSEAREAHFKNIKTLHALNASAAAMLVTLDAINNDIKDIGGQATDGKNVFWFPASLKSLDVSSNENFYTIRGGNANGAKLETFKANDCKLTDGGIFKFKPYISTSAIRNVELRNNKIQSFVFDYVPKLSSLDLSYNDIPSAGSTLYLLASSHTELKTLNLNGNAKLSSLNLVNFPALKALHIKATGITNLSKVKLPTSFFSGGTLDALFAVKPGFKSLKLKVSGKAKVGKKLTIKVTRATAQEGVKYTYKVVVKRKAKTVKTFTVGKKTVFKYKVAKKDKKRKLTVQLIATASPDKYYKLTGANESGKVTNDKKKKVYKKVK
jgi:Leucine-rich repeat (LRR) protein